MRNRAAPDEFLFLSYAPAYHRARSVKGWLLPMLAFGCAWVRCPLRGPCLSLCAAVRGWHKDEEHKFARLRRVCLPSAKQTRNGILEVKEAEIHRIRRAQMMQERDRLADMARATIEQAKAFSASPRGKQAMAEIAAKSVSI